MHNQPQTFTDAKGLPWTLTAVEMSGTQFVLESVESPITVMAKSAQLTVDETKNPVPFVLELDHTTSLEIDPMHIAKLDEFLQRVAEVSA